MSVAVTPAPTISAGPPAEAATAEPAGMMVAAKAAMAAPAAMTSAAMTAAKTLGMGISDAKPKRQNRCRGDADGNITQRVHFTSPSVAPIA
jgi:hypothetical protein